ncbi:YfiR family protein [Pseudoalteromonas luteoviolacea]|uniref:YfiR family protein n=1 Tax=Pseudoalteromonas luteoviolacea TaxID=43657 RepID=UPI001F38F92B|nr:YfiR family protein [Pseudoalteromonas luteoviolacea]MCF6440044.1 YfiR family protein [Pseudoalteromonas luteoviolacea]
MKIMYLIAAFIFIFCSLNVDAKSPHEIRSAFLYQMAKLIDFPEQKNKQVTRFCFYDLTHGPGAILNKNNNLKIRGKPIDIIKVNLSDPFRELSKRCDITYIDETMEDDILSTWTDTITLNMVTVGESIEFLEGGGIASLVQEGSKIRLYINRQEVAQHNFKVLSRLLAVSKFYPD